MRGFRERKRRHDDTHWPNWSSIPRGKSIVRSIKKSLKPSDLPLWLITESDGKTHKLGYYKNEEEAREMAIMFGYPKPFKLTAPPSEGK